MVAASPFAPYKNALLRFQVASGTLQADRNGNLRPARAVVEVEALLEQKRDPNREPSPGVDPSSIWLEGYLVSPRPLPSIVTPDSPASIVWQGREGQFYIEFTARNPYLAALNIDLVERIRGWFLPGSFAVSGPIAPIDPTDPPDGDDDLTLIPFGWGDASPKQLIRIPAGHTIFTVQIVIQVPFDGDTPSLQVGDAANPGRLMSAGFNDPTQPAEYETNPGHTYTTATDLLLTITPGFGCTQGSGFVLIEHAGSDATPPPIPAFDLLDLGDGGLLDLGDGTFLILG